MPQIAVGGTVVPIQNPVNGPGINGINAGDSPIYVGPDPTVNAQSASQTLQAGDVLNWPADESLYVVCDANKVSIFQYSNNGATITKGTLNTNIISGSVEIAGDVTLSGPVELAAGSSVTVDGTVPITGNVGIAGDVNLAAGATVDATITNAQIDVAGGVDILSQHFDVDLLFENSVGPYTNTAELQFYDSFGHADMSKYQTVAIYSAVTGISSSQGAFPTWLILRWQGTSGEITEQFYINGNSQIIVAVKGSRLMASYECIPTTVQNYMAAVTQARTANTIIFGYGAALEPSYVNSPGLTNNPGPTVMSVQLDNLNWGLGDPHFSFQFVTTGAGNVRFYLPSIRGVCNVVVYSSASVVYTSWGNMASRFMNSGINNERLMYIFAQNAIPANTEQPGSFVCPPAGLVLDMQVNGASTVSIVATFQPQ